MTFENVFVQWICRKLFISMCFFVDIQQLSVDNLELDQYEVYHFYLFDEELIYIYFNLYRIDRTNLNSRRARTKSMNGNEAIYRLVR